jgi:zinc protease
MTARRFVPLTALVFALFAAPAAYAVDVRAVPGPQGVEVWLAEEHSLPLIAVSISLPAGSAYDPKGKEGLAAMTAALLDEGGGALSANQFKEALEARAIRLSVSVDRDYVVISLTTLSENASEAFRLLTLAMQQPRFDPDPFAIARSQVIAAIRQEDEDPGAVASRAWFRAYFGSHPYAMPVRGTEPTLNKITRDEIREFAKAHWVRGGSKVAVAGDIGEAQLRTFLDALLGPLPAAAPPPVAAPSQVGTPGTKVIDASVPQPAAVFGVPAPRRADRDFIPAYVANYIFGGGGFTSRLMTEVREKRGLTYGIDSGITDYRAASILGGSVASDKARILTALEVTKAEMARFARDGATAAELADAKTYLTGSFPLSFDSNVKIAGVLGSFQRAGLPADYVKRRNGLIEAVTLEDVNRVARRYFDATRLTIVVAGTPVPPPAAQAEPSTAAQ